MRRAGVIATQRRAEYSGGRFLVLLATLAGLLAMHGLSGHGTMRHGPTELRAADIAGPHAAMTAGAAHDLGDLVIATTAATVTSAAVITDATMAALHAAAGSGVSESGDLHAAMGLCLAILSGAVFLAARRTGRRSYPLCSVLALDIGPRLLPPRARDPDPPDLHALSIQRC